MASLSANLTRARYAAEQSARVGWYMSQYLLARRISGPFDRPGEPAFQPKSKPGKRERIREAFFLAFAQDLAAIEAGLYPPPPGLTLAGLRRALEDAVKFFQDLPAVDARRLARNGVEVRRSPPDEAALSKYPPYYLQNFHYQSGGWLTPESAALYDTQVEILFGGAGDVMRRAGLASLAEGIAGQDQRRLQLIDLGCGTGRFLAHALRAFPKLNATAIDLSPAYVNAARAALAPWPQAEAIVANAEALPLADHSAHAATAVYLFHELPPKVRRAVARELARVLAPGGVFVLVDSLQTGDAEDLDQMLEYFPVGFHEPFYGSYLAEDFAALFADAGFALEDTRISFLTKVMRFRRR